MSESVHGSAVEYMTPWSEADRGPLIAVTDGAPTGGNDPEASSFTVHFNRVGDPARPRSHADRIYRIFVTKEFGGYRF